MAKDESTLEERVDELETKVMSLEEDAAGNLTDKPKVLLTLGIMLSVVIMSFSPLGAKEGSDIIWAGVIAGFLVWILL